MSGDVFPEDWRQPGVIVPAYSAGPPTDVFADKAREIVSAIDVESMDADTISDLACAVNDLMSASAWHDGGMH